MIGTQRVKKTYSIEICDSRVCLRSKTCGVLKTSFAVDANAQQNFKRSIPK